MSQKWIRSKKWDDEHIPKWAWPLRVLLRAFSSIPQAVFLLSCVALYGVLASIPVGLIALAPTYLFYVLTLLGTVAIASILPMVVTATALRRIGVGAPLRFATVLLSLIVLTMFAVWTWSRTLWPALRYDASTHTGVRFFSAFVEANKAITLRRLPGMEMSELEFYGWWPLRVILGAFVLNMVTATVRRIEFKFVNIGVLTVHTGIVTIGIASIYYQSHKQEGDVLVLAGQPASDGTPVPGPAEDGFYDNTAVALWVNQAGRTEYWEQRRLTGVPRYNDYNIDALGLFDDEGRAAKYDQGRRLDLAVPSSPLDSLGPSRLRFRIIGYASYADLEPRWVPSDSVAPGEKPNPMRDVELISLASDGSAPKSAGSFRFLPLVPAARIDVLDLGGGAGFGVEYTIGMDAVRWADLTAPLPPGTQHSLVVEVPAAGIREVYAVHKGEKISVGPAGYAIEVRDLLPEPPFPIITEGYRGGRSSVAIVRVTPPPTAVDARPFTRYVYHRYPEIGQDLLDDAGAGGTPRPLTRRSADPAIRIAYLDASILQVYFDESPLAPATIPAGDAGGVRAAIRSPGGAVRVVDSVKVGEPMPMGPAFGLRLGAPIPHAMQVEAPVVTREEDREKNKIGTHERAALALQVSTGDGPSAWRTTVWLPFAQYALTTSELWRTVALPDGHVLTLAFGRVRHVLPGFRLQLADFQMTPYPNSESPRDFRSDLLITKSWSGAPERHFTSLNEPLLVRVPFQGRSDVPGFINAVGRLASRIVPNQYKFSQAGWDAEGWSQTRVAADRGELSRPFARFTILGVGNNPGIYVIAAGAVMMCAGIPWAFYIKPLLVRRQKKKIQARLAAEQTHKAGAGERGPGAGSNGQAAHADPSERATVPAGVDP